MPYRMGIVLILSETLSSSRANRRGKSVSKTQYNRILIEISFYATQVNNNNNNITSTNNI